ncbi:MAG TPA: hypothetical protein VFP68_12405 [Burkholderiaceae bacterium]|nr:hypothetical protein [Burkholderiaceae bacterium]
MARLWKLMQKDWTWLLEAYRQHCNGKANGQALVRALRDATESLQPDDLELGVPNVQAFTIELNEAMPAVRVLAMGQGGDRRVLLAQPTDSLDGLKNIAGQLASLARRSASGKAAIEGIRKDDQQRDLWKLRRQDPVLQEVIKAWRAGAGADKGADYLALGYLQGLMDGAPHERPDEDNHPEISRFKLTIPGMDRTVDFLVRMREDGRIDDLQGVPDGTQDVGDLLHKMRASHELRQAKRCGPPAGLTQAAGKPRRLAEAQQLVDLLKHVCENKRLNRPLLQDVEKATGISDMQARMWIKPDGTLRRMARAVCDLRGYANWREELCHLLNQLGDPTELPGWLTVAELVDLFKAHKEHPDATPAALARVLGKNAYSVKLVFNGRHFVLSDNRLRSLPDYGEYWQALKKAMRDSGHASLANHLPEPETLPETFLRQLDEHLYLIRLVMSEMQSDGSLAVEDAARSVTASLEVKELARRLLTSKGELRSVDEVATDVAGLDPEQLQTLQQQLQRLQTKVVTANGMVTRMVKGSGQRPAKVFIVHEPEKAAPSNVSRQQQLKVLESLYKDDRRLVAKPRSYRGEPEKQVLRWLATVVKTFATAQKARAREVQAYWDAEEATVWLSSNKVTANRQLAKLLENTTLIEAMNNEAPQNATPRTMRHVSKLQRALAGTVPEGDDAGKPGTAKEKRDAVLKAICAGRIRIPTEEIISDKTGKPADLHAERRIRKSFEEAHKKGGRKIDWRLMSGVMRPCGTCAKDLGLPPEAHRGPFWISQGAQAGYDIEEAIRESVEAGIGTTVSELREGGLDLYANTDSESGESSESDFEADVHTRRRGKRKA